MDGIQKLVFMGVLLGSAAVTLVGLLVTLPQPAEAAGAPPPVNVQPANEADNPARDDDVDAAVLPQDDCAIGRFPDSVNRWCGLITQYAQANGLDVVLVAALILQESGGDPQAYSSSGAVGLMQVMPRDGVAAGFMCINGPCFASRPSMDELFDPDFNVAYGTRFLAGLVAKHGDIRQALFAYGPEGVGYSYADKVLALAEQYR
ncbi:MAG: transglycosylase SLT domain-containing protein [Anaerolineae bacterium]|nr:transglycosylase SLT domain-containing protein [Anaerolineae bacterium]